MKKILFIIIIMLIALPCHSVELLVKANAHWVDEKPQEYKDNISIAQLEVFKQRTQLGDIIVVKPNGHKWGKKENLPKFIIVKIPNVAYEDYLYLENNLNNGDTLIRAFKYSIDAAIVNEAVKNNKSIITISTLTTDLISNGINTKTGLTSEAEVIK